MLAVITEENNLSTVISELVALPKVDVLEVFLLQCSTKPLDRIANAIEQLQAKEVIPKRCTFTWRCTENGERHQNYQRKRNAYRR